MRMKKTIWLGVALLVALACSRQEQQDTETVREQVVVVPEQEKEPAIYVPGQVKLCFDDDMVALIESGEDLETKAPGLQSIMEQLGVVSLERVFPEAGEFEARTRAAGLHRFYVAEYNAALPVTRAVGDLKTVPGVISAAPVRELKLRGFNDPYFSRQWHYVNNQYQNADINVKDVWEQYTTGNADVIVAVVDEGVKYTHEDLAANMWDDGNGHCGYNAVSNSTNITWNRSGDIGHGSHVAGTIAAVSNNGKGVVGIAGGDYAAGIGGARIMSCQIYQGYNSASDTRTARVMKWAADHGAVLMNCSWGYSADMDGNGYVSSWELQYFKEEHFTDPDYADLRNAVDYFLANAGCDADGNQLPDSPMKGGLIFFACGNDNIDWDIISSYEPILAVGAFGLHGTKASYSCYGDWVDIAAPGGDGSSSSNSVWSTVPNEIESTHYSGISWAGTSMACPHATGVAALLVSYFGGPGFTAERCKEYLLGGLGNVIGGSRPIGRKLDAYASFQYGIEAQGLPQTNLPPELAFDEQEITLNALETRTVSFQASDPEEAELSYSFDPGSDAAVLDLENKQVVINGANAPLGTYTAVLTVADPEGLEASASFTYTIVKTTRPPMVAFEQPEVSLTTKEKLNVSYQLSDPDGDELTVSFTPGSDAAVLDADNKQVVITGADAPKGTYKAILTVEDADGFQESATLIYSIVKTMTPPEISLDRTEVTLNTEETAIIEYTTFDADEDELSLSLTPASAAVTLDETNKRLIISGAAAGLGSFSATLTVTDVDGMATSANFRYTVILPPMPPEISLEKDLISVRAHEKAEVWVRASDPNGDAVTLSCNPGSDAFVWDAQAGKAVITGKNAAAGVYTAYFTATDPGGLFTTVSIQYNIFPNHAPELIRVQDNLVFNQVGATATVYASSMFSDSDNETPVLSISCSNPSVVTPSMKMDGTLTLTAAGYGVSDITVTATDALGATGSQTFQVAVKNPQKTMEVFPSTVTDVANIWIESTLPTAVHVEVFSTTGARVITADITASIYNPVSLDVTSLAPGVYTVAATYNGSTQKTRMVKY